MLRYTGLQGSSACGRRRRVPFVLACLALFALPASVSAKPIRRFTPSSAACPVGHIRLNVIYTCAEEFNLRASNGYRLTVFAEAPDGGGTAAQRHEPVEVEVSGSHASVNYLGHGTVGPDRIHASFGQLGVISVRFRPSGRHRRGNIPPNRPPSPPPRGFP